MEDPNGFHRIQVITREDIFKILQIHLIRTSKNLPRHIMKMIYNYYIKMRYRFERRIEPKLGIIHDVYNHHGRVVGSISFHNNIGCGFVILLFETNELYDSHATRKPFKFGFLKPWMFRINLIDRTVSL